MLYVWNVCKLNVFLELETVNTALRNQMAVSVIYV